MKAPLSPEVVAERLADLPEALPGFQLLVLFGSAVRGRAGLRSDVDLAPSAGLRNRLVHEYETIDDAKVLGSIGTILGLYPRYVREVEASLGKLGH